jgi:hypothetical protein
LALLDWYFNLFSNCFREQCEIWVMGYSFLDTHINEKILVSLGNYQSSLFVVDVKTQQEFLEQLEKTDKNLFEAVKKNLRGYYPYTLQQLFPEKIPGHLYPREILRRALDHIVDIHSILKPVVDFTHSK